MGELIPSPSRFVGLDIHKHYLVAVGVDQDKNVVFGPRRVENPDVDEWIASRLSQQDAVVLEMTTNTWTMYDKLLPHVHSVTVVHPPHVALIVRAQVKTDHKAALALAQLHAAGMLVGIWVPPAEVRDLRTLVAQRWKMVRIKTQAMNRLHSMLHRHQFLPPEDQDLFAPETRDWWEKLPVSPVERVRIESDLDTLEFAKKQIGVLQGCLEKMAARDERLPLLVQIPGMGVILAMTLLSAIGDITRFPSAQQLVGYAGFGTRVHDSGTMHQSGRITKAGRREIRWAMVQVAHAACRAHPFWKAEYERLEPRIGRKKAFVAIARKLLVVVWFVLTYDVTDKRAVPDLVASSMFRFAYKVGVANLPDDQSAIGFTRNQLDRLGIGAELTCVRWGTKNPKLPASRLVAEQPASK